MESSTAPTIVGLLAASNQRLGDSTELYGYTTVNGVKCGWAVTRNHAWTARTTPMADVYVQYEVGPLPGGTFVTDSISMSLGAAFTNQLGSRPDRLLLSFARVQRRKNTEVNGARALKKTRGCRARFELRHFDIAMERAPLLWQCFHHSFVKCIKIDLMGVCIIHHKLAESVFPLAVFLPVAERL